jgi:hypothetical protein
MCCLFILKVGYQNNLLILTHCPTGYWVIEKSKEIAYSVINTRVVLTTAKLNN